MAWNEKGGGNNPWNSGGQQGPPDLDKVVRDLQRKLGGLFGGRGGGAGGGGSSRAGGIGFGVIAALLVVVWILSGVYKVDDAERAVVLQFGAYKTTKMPGLHWHIPRPIQSVEKVNVSSVERYKHSTRMLTADENIVVVDTVVQYRRADPQAYLFNVRDPDATISEVAESAIREIVGTKQLDFVLTEGRTAIAGATEELIQSTLDDYGTGLQVTSVNLLDSNFPTQVQSSVQDAIKAREDKERLSLEAQSYANDIVPRARGNAVRQIQDAEAYRERVVADAQGEASRFEALLTEYTKAPIVTRQRLYLQTVEDVFGSTNKVYIDARDSGNLLYLPVDQLMQGSGGKGLREMTTPDAATSTRTTPSAGIDRRSRDDARSRGNR